MCVCVFVCLSVKSQVSVCCENAPTHSAGNEGQKFVAFLLLCRDQVLPPSDGHTYDRHFSCE